VCVGSCDCFFRFFLGEGGGGGAEGQTGQPPHHGKGSPRQLGRALRLSRQVGLGRKLRGAAASREIMYCFKSAAQEHWERGPTSAGAPCREACCPAAATFLTRKEPLPVGEPGADGRPTAGGGGGEPGP
jgi:hypothetical protein